MSSRRLVSDWYTRSNIDEMFDRLICEGDLLEFEDDNHNVHWAVYTGHQLTQMGKKPCVSHYSSENCCNGCLPGNSVKEALFGEDDPQDRWSILEEAAKDVLSMYPKVRISNGLDVDFEPYCSSDIVHKAREKAGDNSVGRADEWVMPSVFRSCKHFALYCRYDENLMNVMTEETQKKVDNLKVAAATAVGATCVGLASYLLYKSCSNPKKKRDSE